MKSLRISAVGIALLLLALLAGGSPARAFARSRSYLTLTPSSSTAKIYAKVKLTGRLKNLAGHALANRRVRVESRPATGTIWSVGSTKTTNSSGKVYWSIQPAASRYYRLRFAGGPKYRPATSSGKKVTGHHYRLAFRDEFSGSSVDTSTWKPTMPWGDTASHFLQRYRPDALATTSGKLVITATHPQPSVDTTYPYYSGAITSSGTVGYTFQYGYVETRAQIPHGQGLWSAVWFHSTVSTSSDEIDVLETRGQYPKTNVMTLHYGDGVQVGKHYPNEEKKAEYAASKAADLSKGFHTFAVDWAPTHVIWYRDGVERFRVTDSAQITNARMHLIVNLQLADGSTKGWQWGGRPDTSTPFPSSFKVDYIRVYKHN
jgi:beta-glucanase (GH16 family)